MVIVIADHLPDAIRGKMKCWFIEPKPGVFVSGINDNLADNVVDYLFEKSNRISGILVFQSINTPPGYKIRSRGITYHDLDKITNLQLIFEKALNNNNDSIDDANSH